VNIGTFQLGRRADRGGEAVLLLSVDEHVPSEVIARIKALPGVGWAKPLGF
jgi:D-3-phosphoglycerate dehydrogenase